MAAKRLAFLALALLLGGAVPGSPAGPSRERGPFLLVGLPSLGTVSWRCDGSGHYALGFHAFRRSADDGLRFHAGRVTRTATVLPGKSIRFPYVNAHSQQLAVWQATEPRTLRATVKVYFAPGYGYCWDYLVPRVEVSVRPQFNF